VLYETRNLVAVVTNGGLSNRTEAQYVIQLIKYRCLFYRAPEPWLLSRPRPADAGFLCNKFAELSDAIKGTPVIIPLVFATLSELMFRVGDYS
jgi:hypothetical protein